MRLNKEVKAGDEDRKVRGMGLPAYGGAHYEVFGGPYKMCPPGRKTFAFNLTTDWVDGDESEDTFHFPIKDYSIPKDAEMQAALAVAVRQISMGKVVFIGCGWGRGRTGLFMACLAKAWGMKNPVAYTRKNYLSLAVETAEQHAFIRDLPIPFRLRFLVVLAKAKGFFRGKDLTGLAAKA